MAVKKTAQTGNLQQAPAGGFQPCTLTWYDPALGGTNSASGKPDPHSHTKSGEPYDANKDTCAAPPQYSFGTMITFFYGGTTVVCRVNDRGGAITGSHFDLSRHAAQTLGIINAGKVNAQFAVGGNAGLPADPHGGPPAGGGGGSLTPLKAIEDLLTLNFTDLATGLAIAAVGMVKDIGLGVVDWIVIPWWHWNQRAAQYYVRYELFADDKDHWTVFPWTAAFWGIGYWLFWTDPDSASPLKPTSVRRSRIGRHVRTAQGLPARRSLIKPRDVKEKTPAKPAAVTSRAPVSQTGTMTVTRSLPVRVSGEHARRTETGNAVRSETPVEREGTLPTDEATRRNATHPQPDAANRTGNDSLPDSRRATPKRPRSGNGTDGRKPRRR